MYDCTFYVENDLDVSIAHWLKGQPSTISLVCSRIDLSEIPTDPDESKAYLNQLFHEKVPSVKSWETSKYFLKFQFIGL